MIMLKNRIKTGMMSGGCAVFALLALTLFAGCSRSGYSRSLRLPPDPSMIGNTWWFLVTADYAQAQIQADAASPAGVSSAMVIRKGTILECSERRIGPQGLDSGGLLYRFKDGGRDYWMSEKFGQAFFSLQEAEKARAGM